jgi:hypothetical protein
MYPRFLGNLEFNPLCFLKKSFLNYSLYCGSKLQNPKHPSPLYLSKLRFLKTNHTDQTTVPI